MKCAGLYMPGAAVRVNTVYAWAQQLLTVSNHLTLSLIIPAYIT